MHQITMIDWNQWNWYFADGKVCANRVDKLIYNEDVLSSSSSSCSSSKTVFYA